jgi:hypothetical protein
MSMNYGYAEKSDYAQTDVAVEAKLFDRCIGEATVIREQVTEASKLAEGILTRLTGPQPEECGENNVKELYTDGAVGELQRQQGGSVARLADLRRTLERIARIV